MANPDHDRIARSNPDAGTDLSGFDLSGALLTSARLEGCDLSAANFRRANLCGAYLKQTKFRSANMSQVRITTGDLRQADLSNANLKSADLSDSVLSGALLVEANLTGAKLVKVRVDQVDFTDADLTKADFRGAMGLTKQQIEAAKNVSQAIFDPATLKLLGLAGDEQTARHGRQSRSRQTAQSADLAFRGRRPCFGDVFLMCGSDNPEFPSTGEFNFANLEQLGIEQVDDYFAVCRGGDPTVWIYPLVNGHVVDHHAGPFDGLRISPDASKHRSLWQQVVDAFQAALEVDRIDH